ncbi:hypothetical protein EJB05_00742, partial [Eragrostis curvula]
MFMRASDALSDKKDHTEWKDQKCWWKRRRSLEHEENAGQELSRGGRTRRARRITRKKHEDEGFFMGMLEAVIGNFIHSIIFICQVAAVATCMTLSLRRIKKQDYINLNNPQQDVDNQNISLSLNIFYVLVLAQGVIFILLLMNLLVSSQRIHIKFVYKLFTRSGRNILIRYQNDNFLEFITGNVRPTLNMNLITFAKNLVVSSSRDDQLLGIKAMDGILRSVKYRSLVLVRLGASLDAEALGKLLNLLGRNRDKDEKDIRGHAARVVLKLAPNLLVENFPQILRLISCSLLHTSSMKMSNMDVDLVWFGLRILDKLTDNPENCKQFKDHDGDLLSKIIDLTNLCDHGSTRNTISDSWIEQEIIPLLQKEDDIPHPFVQKIDQEIIVGMSLNILSKLVATSGAAGEDLRRETSKHFNFLSNTGIILEHVEAIKVISCLAIDAAVRKEIGMLPGIMKKLKDCLLSKPPYVNITKVAAKLLLLEYSTSEQLNKIQLFIEGNQNLEDQTISLPVSAFIEELDKDQLLPPWRKSIVQKFDLEDLLLAPRTNHSEAAAEALCLITTGCQNNVVALLHEIDAQELETIVNMLSSSSEDAEKEKRRKLAHLEGRNLDPETLRTFRKIFCAGGEEHARRSMLAKLLQNLHAYSGQEKVDHHIPVIDKALSKVFKAIVDEVATLENALSTNGNLSQIKDDLQIKGGRVLESFMGLSVQICRSVDANYFAKALVDVHLKLDTFVQKLKKILELFRSPTTDFPSIRRSTLELMTWMVKNNGSYRDVLLQCGVYEQLNEVKMTARKLESSKLFHCGVDVLGDHGILCISYLANELMEQLQLCPSFLERCCYREPAGTISVLIA